jgi:hypothetical protein
MLKTQKSKADPFAASSLLRQVIPVFTESLLALVEKTLECMESKILLIAKGAKQFFFLHMIMALVKGKLWPDQAAALKKSVVDRIGVIAYSLLAHQNAVEDSAGIEPVGCILCKLEPRNANDPTEPASEPDIGFRSDSTRQYECL